MWRASSTTKITIRPVIDLNQTETIDGYEVSDRLKEHIALRDQRCVFPYCERAARPNADDNGYSTDADHVIPHRQGGSTSTDNLAPLCRWHHQDKTTGGWTYQMITPGLYHWRAPYGRRYLRDTTGTRDLGGD